MLSLLWHGLKTVRYSCLYILARSKDRALHRRSHDRHCRAGSSAFAAAPADRRSFSGGWL